MAQGQSVLLAIGREYIAAPRILDMSDISTKLQMTGSQLRARREKLNLTQSQIAQLARKNLSVRIKRTAQSIQVGKWENGTHAIPLAVSELIGVKLFLLENELVSFDDLISFPLVDLIRDMHSNLSSELQIARSTAKQARAIVKNRPRER